MFKETAFTDISDACCPVLYLTVVKGWGKLLHFTACSNPPRPTVAVVGQPKHDIPPLVYIVQNLFKNTQPQDIKWIQL